MNKSEKLLEEARECYRKIVTDIPDDKLSIVHVQELKDKYEQSHTELKRELLKEVNEIVEKAIKNTKPFWGEKIIYKHEAIKSAKSALKKLEVSGKSIRRDPDPTVNINSGNKSFGIKNSNVVT